jgi:hypothetical protein
MRKLHLWMSIKTFWKHMEFLMKTGISDVIITPTTGLDITVLDYTPGVARLYDI